MSDPIIVYVYRGPGLEIPWREIKRAIVAQLGPDAALSLTITCNAVEKSAPEHSGDERDRSSVTIADVAREANVSNSTVSKVLNDYTAVSHQTRVRVEAAVRRMNYRPNEAARLMVRSKRTKQNGAAFMADPSSQEMLRDAAPAGSKRD